MRRGTTQTNKFKTKTDVTGMEALFITYRQEGRTIIEKSLPDIEIYEEVKTVGDEEETIYVIETKLNPNQNIDVNADGQLEVGGRIGQFEGTTGLFAPNDRDPRNVLDYSLLITDALGVDMSANRAMAVVSGFGIACISAPPGTTQYQISNTYENRIAAKLCENGYLAVDEATSKVKRIVPVVSVTINGSTFYPSSAANDSTKPIVITVEESVNPDTTVTNIRLFGRMESYASLHVGNGIRSGSGGRSLMLGGAITKHGGNDQCMIGMNLFATGNGNAMFGRYHIARKNRGFFAGTGHDSTNARAEAAAAVGTYSYMDANTLFAVGNGTSHTARSNAFEVRDDGIVIKSPNGTRYKLVVANDGTLSTAAVT